MRRIFAIWALCLCWGVLNAAPLGPFNATLLEKLKTDYQKGDKEVIQYIELQEKAAEKYIKMSPLSVTAKKKLPPSKDPRDYMTLSPYWWPDSTKTDGLPYIRKDGERNPEVYEYPERENANRFWRRCLLFGRTLLHHRKRSLRQSLCRSFTNMVYRPEIGYEPQHDLCTIRSGNEKYAWFGLH